MNLFFLARSFVFVAGLAAGLVLRADTLVYSNTNALFGTDSAALNYRSPVEFGDEIVLAGDVRKVTEFTFAYAGLFVNKPDANVVIRFYANDGLDSDPGPKVIRGPGSLLWESPSISILPTTQTLRVLRLSVPEVVVPNSFTWTALFSNVGAFGDGQGAGLIISSPANPARNAEIGGGFNDFWIKEDAWAGRVFQGTKANFYAQVVAVPEPSTVALAILGTTATLFVCRRKR